VPCDRHAALSGSLPDSPDHRLVAAVGWITLHRSTMWWMRRATSTLRTGRSRRCCRRVDRASSIHHVVDAKSDIHPTHWPKSKALPQGGSRFIDPPCGGCKERHPPYALAEVEGAAAGWITLHRSTMWWMQRATSTLRTGRSRRRCRRVDRASSIHHVVDVKSDIHPTHWPKSKVLP